MIDIHTHILPGVDDGAKDLRMTEEMLERASGLGIRAIVCTPHVYRLSHQKRIKNGLGLIRQTAKQYGIRIFSGCEFNYHMLSQVKMDHLDSFCIASTPCILLELSNDYLFSGWEAIICEMVDNGYLPIIAHPERYAYIQKDLEIANTMCDFGCELQVDAGGLMAGLFTSERKTARAMLSKGMVSYIASDAHEPKHYATYEKAYRVFKNEWPRSNRLRTCLRRKKQEVKSTKEMLTVKR